MNTEDTSGTHTPRIVVSWAIVTIPLAYGIFETLKKASQLFG
jgi:hypothetical protein